jgi:hypothetical protein
LCRAFLRLKFFFFLALEILFAWTDHDLYQRTQTRQDVDLV